MRYVVMDATSGVYATCETRQIRDPKSDQPGQSLIAQDFSPKPEQPRAWFLQSKQRQQMWQAAAAGGSSRQNSKQACMRAEMRSYPSVCACVHAETHDVAAKRQGGACLS